MSVLQKVRMSSNERLDLPDFLNVENFACADWAQFFDKFMSNQSMVIQGFDISDPRALCTGATPASSGIRINIANSVMFHPTSSGAGGGFFVATPTEAAQTVSLSENATNYIEIDQTVETGSPDIRKFWNPDTGSGEGQEFSQIVDTVIYLKAEMSSNTVGFTDGRIPVAKVVTTTTIQSITDCRPMFFRLGSGGTNPDALFSHEWSDVPTGNARIDSPLTVSAASPSGTNPFKGSDKNIRHFKDWMNAMMSVLKEIKGTPYWFSANANINSISLPNLWWDSIGSRVTGSGSMANAGAGVLQWTSDIFVRGIVGRYYFKIDVADSPITLGDDQVAYISQQRHIPLSSSADLTWVNGATYVNGSTGSFTGLVAGDFIKKASDGWENYVQILDFHANLDGGGAGGQPASTALSVTLVAGTTYDGVAGVEQAVYAKSEYTPIVADRKSVPNSGDIWYLAIREDEGGAKERIMLRGGSELESGESIEIGDETSDQTFAYIGASSEADGTPDYDAESIATGAKTGTESYNSTNNENLTARSAKVTSMMADKAQDKNVRISGGGVLTWVLGAPNQLAFTADITVAIGSSTNLNTIQVAQSPKTIPAGQCVYFTINRNAAANLTLTVDTLANVPLDENTFILAYHDANDSHLYFMDGTRLVDSEVNHLGGIDFFNADTAFTTVVDDITFPGMSGDFKLSLYPNASACIQAAIDSIKSTTGGTVYVRTGAYTLTEDISFENTTKDVVVTGDKFQTVLDMPNIAAHQEAFVANGGVFGFVDVAAGTSFNVLDYVEVTSNTQISLLGWITTIAPGVGFGGGDRLTISYDSAGAVPLVVNQFLTADSARVNLLEGAAFTIPKDITNITLKSFKIINSNAQDNIAITLNDNKYISINDVVADGNRNAVVTSFGSVANATEYIDITDCNINQIGVSPNITPILHFRTFINQLDIHDNKLVGAFAKYAIMIEDVGTTDTQIGKWANITNNEIEISGDDLATYGIFIRGWLEHITIADNIVLVDSDGTLARTGIFFSEGNWSISNCVFRAVLTGNHVFCENVVTPHAFDRALWLAGNNAGAYLNDFVVTGNNFQTTLNNATLYCVSFKRVQHLTISGNRCYGGTTSSVYYDSTVGQNCEHVATGVNYLSKEAPIASIGINRATAIFAPLQVVKGWAKHDGGVGGALASYNVSGVVRTGTGQYTITWIRLFASSDYSYVVTSDAFSATSTVASQTSSVVVINLRNSLGVLVNAPFMVTAIGNSANAG